jgi:hypothetical protein
MKTDWTTINTGSDHIIVRLKKGGDSWTIENYGTDTDGSPRLCLHGDIGEVIAEGQAFAEANPNDQIYLVEVRFVHPFTPRS